MTVNLSMLAGAGQQFFDANGDPLTGGKLYIYAAGTTTPATAYTTVDGDVPLANPITLDAAGNVPTGEIWLTDGLSYKFVLQTSAGVTLGTWDNITGNGSGIYDAATTYVLNSLSAPTGSSLVGYVQTTSGSAGATNRTVQAKLRDTVSVKDFGATGDGVTDDTAAFQAAADYSASVGGAEIFVPPGKYVIANSVTDLNIVSFVGVGLSSRNNLDYGEDGGSLILIPNSLVSPFVIGGTGGVTFKGLTFYWPNQTGASATPVGYPELVSGTPGFQMVDVTFIECIVLNAYVFFRSPPSCTVIGAINVIDCRIYAIFRAFWLECGAAEVIRIENSAFSPGVAQNLTIFDGSGYLATWSGANGTFMYSDVAASPYTSVDGLQVLGCFVFGSRYGIEVVSGTLSLPTIQGTTFDGVATALSVTNSASVSGITFDALLYLYQYRGSGEAYPGINIQNGGGLFRGVFNINSPYCAGNLCEINSTGLDQLTIYGSAYAWGKGASATGDKYAFYVNAPNGSVSIQTGAIRGEYADAIGVIGIDVRGLTVTGVGFDNTKVPVYISSSFTGKWTVTGCTSSNTSSANSLLLGVYGKGTSIGNVWDKAGPVFVTFSGPYADDVAAAAANISIGEAYRKTGGTVAWRVS